MPINMAIAATWFEFCTGPFAEMLSTEYYGEQYPELQDAMDNQSNVVQEMAETLGASGDQTKNLRIFLTTLLDNSRYATEFADELHDVVAIFVKRGADPRVCRVAIDFRDSCGRNWEDYIGNFGVRGMIIDEFREHMNMNLDKWQRIKPVYWEDAEFETESYTELKRNVYGYMKYCSSFMSGIGVNNIESNEE
jgi:hypothetical protein